ncbi:hypothetical protein BLA29_005382, partial [Euroglyphus maynei]
MTINLTATTKSKTSDTSLDIDSQTNVCLAWRNLRFEVKQRNYFLPIKQSSKIILRRLNGTLEYHHLTGFMGPSGAGKTTLLNCLNGNVRDSGLTRDSEIYLNKFERQAPKIGFIEQHVNETIIGRLTVREILRHAFLFKNGWKFRSRAQIHIDSITDELMLDRSVLDRRFKHCSGGEQKRIAVAQELMSLVPPSLLFIDEPTTGLDSNAAFLVMRCLRKLANRYRMTVAVSIHTPNAEIVEMFDKLYILARGGVCIYSGTPSMLQENLRQQLNPSSDINPSVIEEKDDNQHERPPIEQYLKIACNGLESDSVRLLADRTLEMENEKLLPHISRLDFLPWGTPRHLKPFTIGDLFLQLSRLFRVVFIVNGHVFLLQILMYVLSYLFLTFTYDPQMVRPSGCYSVSTENQTCGQKLNDDALMETYVSYQSFCIMYAGFGMVGMASVVFSPLLK